MKEDQWRAVALEDQEACKQYEAYGRLLKAHRLVKTLLKVILIPLTVVLGAMVAVLESFLLLVVLVVVPPLIMGSVDAGFRRALEQSWEKGGESIVRSAAEAYFGEVRFVECWKMGKPLETFAPADSREYSQRLNGRWNETEFWACQLRMKRGDEDLSSKLLFSGLLLEVAVDPELEQGLTAKLVGRKSKYVAGSSGGKAAIGREPDRVFSEGWMHQLREASRATVVMACVRTGEGGKRLLQLGFDGVEWDWMAWQDLSYQMFLYRLARNMEMLQRLLDIIRSNQALFGELE